MIAAAAAPAGYSSLLEIVLGLKGAVGAAVCVVGVGWGVGFGVSVGLGVGGVVGVLVG